MDEVVDMAHGVPQSYGIDEFADEGIMLEGIAGPPDYLAMAVPFSGAAHRELMLSHRHVAQFGMMIRDTSKGRIPTGRLAPAPVARSSATTSTPTMLRPSPAGSSGSRSCSSPPAPAA